MYKLVDGMYDYLPLESYSLHELGDKLIGSYQSRGFMRIDTPMLERYELFEDAKMTNVAEGKLFKLIDGDGSILVMRPDMTMPIARVVSTKINQPERNKYCYLSNSFCFKSKGVDIREFTQVGVELFAPSSTYVDADVIAMAINSLKMSGLEDFQVEIGHVGYFEGLLEQLELDTNGINELLALINAKDTFGIELFAQRNIASKEIIEAILDLPMLFGGEEVLEKAKIAANNGKSTKAIDELSEINSLLRAYGLCKYISYDLSLVNEIGYYSGTVFKGISRHFGASILSGGRYDKLCDNFGKSLDATGFAIGLNNLLVAARRESGQYMTMPRVDVKVGGGKIQAKAICEFINQAVARELTVENTYIDEIDEFKNCLCGSEGVFFDSDGGRIEING